MQCRTVYSRQTQCYRKRGEIRRQIKNHIAQKISIIALDFTQKILHAHCKTVSSHNDTTGREKLPCRGPFPTIRTFTATHPGGAQRPQEHSLNQRRQCWGNRCHPTGGDLSEQSIQGLCQPILHLTRVQGVSDVMWRELLGARLCLAGPHCTGVGALSVSSHSEWVSQGGDEGQD